MGTKIYTRTYVTRLVPCVMRRRFNENYVLLCVLPPKQYGSWNGTYETASLLEWVISKR